jgi:transcriptional regulator with XRE-family HTH domain
LDFLLLTNPNADSILEEDWSTAMTLIEIHRRAKGWTQRQLAKRVGCSTTIVSLWESGNIPSRRYLQKVADELDITTLQIIESSIVTKSATTSAA